MPNMKRRNETSWIDDVISDSDKNNLALLNGLNRISLIWRKKQKQKYYVCTRVRIAYAISVFVEVLMIFMHIFDNLQQVLLRLSNISHIIISIWSIPFIYHRMWFIWMRAKCENIFETKKKTLFSQIDWSNWVLHVIPMDIQLTMEFIHSVGRSVDRLAGFILIRITFESAPLLHVAKQKLHNNQKQHTHKLWLHLIGSKCWRPLTRYIIMLFLFSDHFQLLAIL